MAAQRSDVQEPQLAHAAGQRRTHDKPMLPVVEEAVAPGAVAGVDGAGCGQGRP